MDPGRTDGAREPPRTYGGLFRGVRGQWSLVEGWGVPSPDPVDSCQSGQERDDHSRSGRHDDYSGTGEGGADAPEIVTGEHANPSAARGRTLGLSERGVVVTFLEGLPSAALRVDDPAHRDARDSVGRLLGMGPDDEAVGLGSDERLEEQA